MVSLRSVLDALVTMQDQSFRDLFVFLGLLEGLQDQSNIIASMQDMPDNEAIEQVLDDGQISPALLQANEGNIGDPLLVGSLGDKIAVENIVVAVEGAEILHLAVGIRLA